MRRSTMTTFMLVITLASPSLAQKEKVVDQQIRQQVEAVVTKFVEAINKGDAKAYEALFVSGGINVTPFGKFKSGDTQFAESINVPHKKGLTLTTKVDDVEPIYGGQGAVATAPYTGSFTNNPGTSQVHGNLLFVLERAGDSWKIRAHSASRQVDATEGK